MFDEIDEVSIIRKFEKKRNPPENDGKFHKPMRGIGIRHVETSDSED